MGVLCRRVNKPCKVPAGSEFLCLGDRHHKVPAYPTFVWALPSGWLMQAGSSFCDLSKGWVKHRQVPAGSNSPSVLPWVKNGDSWLFSSGCTDGNVPAQFQTFVPVAVRAKMVKREVSQGSSLCIGKSHQIPTFCGHGPMVKHRMVQSSRFYIAHRKGRAVFHVRCCGKVI